MCIDSLRIHKPPTIPRKLFIRDWNFPQDINWHPYLHTSPQKANYANLFRSQGSVFIKRLKCAALSLRHEFELLRTFLAKDPGLQKSQKRRGPTKCHEIMLRAEELSYDDFLWGVVMVQSRVFTVRDALSGAF